MAEEMQDLETEKGTTTSSTTWMRIDSSTAEECVFLEVAVDTEAAMMQLRRY